MALNVALVITGDSSAAKKAAAEAKQGLKDLGDAAGDAAKKVAEHGSAVEEAAHSAEMFSTQAMSLQHALRGGITELAAGIPPTQVLAQNLNHLVYAASGPGGLKSAFGEVGGALKSGASYLTSLLTPATLATAAVVAIGGGALIAAANFEAGQRDIVSALSGIGRASGATVDDINRIARASASLKGLSVPTAREVATTFAATGQISPENIEAATKVTENLALALKIDAGDAANYLAKALASGGKGVDDLNAKFGFLNDKLKVEKDSLYAQNRDYEAQRIAIEGVASATASAANNTSLLSRAWQGIKNIVPNVADAVGHALVVQSGGGGDAEQLATAQAKVDRLTSSLAIYQNEAKKLSALGMGEPEIAKAVPLLAIMTEQLRQAQAHADGIRADMDATAASAAQAASNAASIKLGNVISAAAPDLKREQDLKDLVGALSKPGAGALGGLDPEKLKQYPISLAQATEALRSFEAVKDRATAAGRTFTEELEVEKSALAKQATDALSPAARAAAQRQQTLLSLTGQLVDPATKNKLANDAAYSASGGEAAQINLTRQHVAALGDLATVDQLVLAKAKDLQLANLQGAGLTGDEIRAVLLLTRAQAERNRVDQAAQLGVFNAAEAKLTAQHQLEAAALKGLIKTDQDRTNAQIVLQKQLEETQKSAAIAAAQLPNLKQLQIESGSLRTQLDTTATSVSSAFGNFFVDIGTGSKTTKQAFQDLALSIEKSLLTMMTNMLIVMPIARELQAILSGFLPGVGGGTPLQLGPNEPVTPVGGLTASAGIVAPPFRPQSMMPPPSGAAAGASMNLQVVVKNMPAGSTLQESGRRRDGNTEIVEFVHQTVNQGIGSGRYDDAQRQRTGLGVKPIRR